MKKFWTKYKTTIQSILTFSAIFFIVKYLFDNRESLIDFNWQFNLFYFFFFFFFMCVEPLIGLWAVLKLITIHQPNYKKNIVTQGFFLTKLYSYIPGGVWNHLGLGVAMKKAEIIDKSIVSILILNIAISVWACAFFLIFLIPINYAFMFVIFYIFITLLVPKIISLINQLIARIGFKKLKIKELSLKELVTVLVIDLILWGIIGLNFLLLVATITNLNNFFGNSVKIISSYNISWLAGFLVLPLPAGMGVREAVLSYFLGSQNLISVLAVSLSIIFRIAILLRDLLFYLLWNCFKKNNFITSD